ncbi:MAG: diguanylate cyclase [Candidatus Accumulibacter sp.]|jgi:diguanylate cyclase (GGDEF)-like protein/hemerythrin-like metal-binding protein|nr:diguanylate cyclase [Accumulibacter sp.]
MMGTLVALALFFAGRLDRTQDLERYALVGIGLLLVLTLLASSVFFIRLGALRTILRRLDALSEKYFGDAPRERPVRYRDECEEISFALRLLEERIAARERSERNLRQHDRISASILKALHQSVIVADSRGNIILFSQGAEAMLGYSADEIIGKQTPMLFHDPDEVRRRAEELTEELCIPVVADTYTLIAKALATGQVDEREWTYLRKDGVRLAVLLSVTVFFDDHGDVMFCCVATDITERSRAAAEILRLANYDPLTQLPNRRLFHDRIHMAIIQARRKGAKFGLLMIDLDRFKPINDEYGHSVGDLLLSAVAERMQKCLRESDTLARVGGDEFVAILPTIGSTRDATKVARKIRRSIGMPFELTDEITVQIDCSIGLAIHPDHGDDGDSLLKSADDAMYVAKSMGRAKIYFVGGAVEMEGGLPDGNRNEGRDSEPIIWRHTYQCGEETIDRQHKDIFMYSNSMIHAIENDALSPDELSATVDKFAVDVSEHLDYEESLLLRLAYPGLDAHRRKHQELRERMRNLCRLVAARELSMDALISFIEWSGIAQHMLIDDHEYFPFLKQAMQQNSADTP